jgi:succinate dehydrogenase / fumarate reductase, cytochrome b subunit
MNPTITKRSVYRNIDIGQVVRYRLPAAGWVSILHRISGALMFVLLPFVIWMFDASVTSQTSYDRFMAVFAAGSGIVPALLLKLIALALIWAFLLHLIAGLRHLWMDVSHRAVELRPGRRSATFTLVASVLLTLAFGYTLFF